MRFLVFLLLPCFLFAEDIYLKNGKVYKNVQIIDEGLATVTFNFNKSTVKVASSDIMKISVIPYQSDKISTEEFEKAQPIAQSTSRPLEEPERIVISQYNNLWALSLGFAAGILSYHYFNKASNQNDVIEAFHLGSEYIEKKNDNLTIGWVCLGASMLFTYWGLQTTDIIIDRGVTVSYKIKL